MIYCCFEQRLSRTDCNSLDLKIWLYFVIFLSSYMKGKITKIIYNRTDKD